MKIYCAVATIAFSGFFTTAFPQSKAGTVIDLPKSDPFKITAGSSFSASSPVSLPEQPVSKSEATRKRILHDVAEAVSIIKKNYGQQVNNEGLFKAATDGALKSLDPHSNYFDPSEYRDLLDDEQGEYSGIGATIASYSRGGRLDTFVVATTPGSPAERAGLRFGDRITDVNGESVEGSNSDVVRDKIRGREGTEIRMIVQRVSSGGPVSIVIRRSMVPQHTVADAYMVKPGLGYIELSGGFDYKTSAELGLALNNLKRQGMTGLILDLRGNPGGIMEEAVKVAEKFLSAGTLIVSQRGRFKPDDRAWRSNNKTPESMPLVVLVDGGSASASEILTGALQDNDRALVVGERTFGKGLVQSVFDLPNLAGLTLTTARYYTPSGRSIQRDYARVGLYDYYHRHLSGSANEPTEARTVTDRKVYGGDGIQPDETIMGPRINNDQMALMDAVFFFVRDHQVSLNGGKLSSTAKVRFSAEADANSVLPEFLTFAKANFPQFSESLLQKESAFIHQRLVYDMTTASAGSEAAKRTLAMNDPQIQKAVELMPRAGELADSAAKLRPVNTSQPKAPLISKARKKPAE